MANTIDRLRAMAREHLEVDESASSSTSWADAGISSVDAVSFIKLVNDEFGVSIGARELADVNTLEDIGAFIDG